MFKIGFIIVFEFVPVDFEYPAYKLSNFYSFEVPCVVLGQLPLPQLPILEWL